MRADERTLLVSGAMTALLLVSTTFYMLRKRKQKLSKLPTLLERSCEDSSRRIRRWLRTDAADEAASRAQILASLEIIEDIFKKHPDNSSINVAFNGGKDCLVVLHLLLAVCHELGRPVPSVVYFDKPDEFDEMMSFMETCERDLGFQVRRLLERDFKQSLKRLVEERVEVVFMGQRSTDPHAPSTPLAPSTEGWPRILRVNPILNCTYETVWCFLIGCGFKYCSLYDEGYTSLGSKSETKRNPALSGTSGEQGYRSAKDLKGGDLLERHGRSVSSG